ncbi:MAG: hypothetical protein AB1894_27080 [Chloroflexota bacterium]
MIWPTLFAWAVARKRAGNFIARSDVSLSANTGQIVSFVLALFVVIPFTFRSLRLSAVTGGPIHDAAYYASVVDSALTFFPLMVLYFLSMICGAEFRAHGVFYNGVLWAWSDFECYRWRELENRVSRCDLLLEIKPGRLHGSFHVPVATKNRPVIECLLAEQITSGYAGADKDPAYGI